MEHSFDLEILISFNSSEDETLEAALELQAQYPALIRFRLNEQAVGYGPNVDAVVRESKGDFVVILSDDDMLEPDALSTIWNILNAHSDVGAVFLNNTPWDTELLAPLTDYRPISSLTGGIFYANGEDYILNHGYPPFLISGVVVRRIAWGDAVRREFLNSICIHTQTIILMLATNSAFLSHISAIRYRTNATNGGWPSDELFPFAFELDLLTGYQAAKGILSKRSLRCLHRHSMTQIAHSIMNVKISGRKIAYGMLRARLRDLCNKWSMLYWLNLVILRTPACVLPPIFYLSNWIRNATRKNK